MPNGPGSGPPINGPIVISSPPAIICTTRIAGRRMNNAREGGKFIAMRYG